MGVAYSVGLTAMLLVGCGTAGRQPTGRGEAGANAGDGGQGQSGGRLCAAECSVFCGTKAECTPSGGGEGGIADGESRSLSGR